MPRTSSRSLLKKSLTAIKARPYVAAGVIAGTLAASARGIGYNGLMKYAADRAYAETPRKPPAGLLSSPTP
jgi:hypothetical protein